MKEGTNDLSRAITVYLGFGLTAAPQRDEAGVMREFGAEKGATIMQDVLAIVDETFKIEVDWSKHSLQSAGEMARNKMHYRHFDLSESALKALEWDFTFAWR